MTVKDRINARIAALDNLIKSNGKVLPFDAREGGILDGEISMADDEIEFLKELLTLVDEEVGLIHKPKPVDPNKMDEIGRKIGEVKSWAGDVDRQGGSFTDAEINSRLTGW